MTVILKPGILTSKKVIAPASIKRRRTRSPLVKTPVQLAAAAFESNNFRLAADLLKDDKYVLEDEDARYIRANARFALGQFAGAAKDFDALKDSFQFRYEARWNFLLCQIALGNMEISKVLLAEMVTDQDFPFRAKAMELSGKLNL